MWFGGCQGPGKGENWEQLPNEKRVSSWGTEYILELDRSGSCTTLNVHNLTGLLTLIQLTFVT